MLQLYRFTKDELATYKSLAMDSDNRSDFMTACKSKDACQKLLDLLALDYRYLTICDALPTHGKEPFREAAAGTASVLRDDERQDDDSEPEQGGGGMAADERQRTPPTPMGKEKSQHDDLRMWLPLRPNSIAATGQRLPLRPNSCRSARISLLGTT